MGNRVSDRMLRAWTIVLERGLLCGKYRRGDWWCLFGICSWCWVRDLLKERLLRSRPRGEEVGFEFLTPLVRHLERRIQVLLHQLLDREERFVLW